ncbi:hypothetical protein KR009_008950, partial [Drosophila setifemur]
IKSSPYTSPIGTPSGVIKFEPGSGLEDHNEHELRIDSGRATPSHCPGHLRVPKIQPRHGNGDNDDDDDSSDERQDSEEPCDLSMDLARLLAVAHGGGVTGALPLGHPHHPHHHAHHQHGRALIYPPVARPETPTRRFSGGSGAPGVPDTTSSAAAVIAGLVTNNTSATVPGGVVGAGGASTSAAAAAAAAAPGNWNQSGGGGGNSGGGGGGAYACDRCGNTYARPHSLNRHVRFECGVEPKFECPICHKKSKHKHNLVLHMRTHQHR